MKSYHTLNIFYAIYLHTTCDYGGHKLKQKIKGSILFEFLV